MEKSLVQIKVLYWQFYCVNMPAWQACVTIRNKQL